MALKMVTLIIGLVLIFAHPAISATPTCGSWFLSDNTGTVSSLNYELLSSTTRIVVVIKGEPTPFYYPFSSSDQVSIAKAGAIYAGLLTALSTGVPVHLYLPATCVDASGKDFTATSVGAW